MSKQHPRVIKSGSHSHVISPKTSCLHSDHQGIGDYTGWVKWARLARLAGYDGVQDLPELMTGEDASPYSALSTVLLNPTFLDVRVEDMSEMGRPRDPLIVGMDEETFDRPFSEDEIRFLFSKYPDEGNQIGAYEGLKPQEVLQLILNRQLQDESYAQGQVFYPLVQAYKDVLLRRSFNNFATHNSDYWNEFESFCLRRYGSNDQFDIQDDVLFTALRVVAERRGVKPPENWREWTQALGVPVSSYDDCIQFLASNQLSENQAELRKEVLYERDFQLYIQWQSERQRTAAQQYITKDLGMQVAVDAPASVSSNSVEGWKYHGKGVFVEFRDDGSQCEKGEKGVYGSMGVESYAPGEFAPTHPVYKKIKAFGQVWGLLLPRTVNKNGEINPEAMDVILRKFVNAAERGDVVRVDFAPGAVVSFATRLGVLSDEDLLKLSESYLHAIDHGDGKSWERIVRKHGVKASDGSTSMGTYLPFEVLGDPVKAQLAFGNLDQRTQEYLRRKIGTALAQVYERIGEECQKVNPNVQFVVEQDLGALAQFGQAITEGLQRSGAIAVDFFKQKYRFGDDFTPYSTGATVGRDTQIMAYGNHDDQNFVRQTIEDYISYLNQSDADARYTRRMVQAGLGYLGDPGLHDFAKKPESLPLVLAGILRSTYGAGSLHAATFNDIFTFDPSYLQNQPGNKPNAPLALVVDESDPRSPRVLDYMVDTRHDPLHQWTCANLTAEEFEKRSWDWVMLQRFAHLTSERGILEKKVASRAWMTYVDHVVAQANGEAKVINPFEVPSVMSLLKKAGIDAGVRRPSNSHVATPHGLGLNTAIDHIRDSMTH